MKLRQFEGRCEIPWTVLSLTHCGLVNQYGVIQLGQHWFSQCFNAWHLAITLTNVDWSSVTSCGIHLRAISLGTSNVYILDMSLKITYTRLHPHIPRVNDLKLSSSFRGGLATCTSQPLVNGAQWRILMFNKCKGWDRFSWGLQEMSCYINSSSIMFPKYFCSYILKVWPKW